VSTTSPQEKLQYATEAQEEMREHERHVARLLESAKRDDPEAVPCIDDRLIEIRTLAKVGEGAQGPLGDALAAEQEERAAHEFRKIAVALMKTRQLRAEADACMGEIGSADGTTTIAVDGGGEDQGETDAVEFFALDFGIDPPDASPFD